MNKLTIIGNLTRNPELRTTPSGINVCSFTVAVNRKKQSNGEDEADFFRVSAWRQLADICSKYLSKGRKVAVIGSVSLHTYETQNGKHGASMEVTADDIEFLSPRQEEHAPVAAPVQRDEQTQMEMVQTDDLPF